jgi:cellulose biosynthesis protein BcsQ
LEAADLALVIGDARSGESMVGMAKLMAEIETARSRRATVPEMVIPVINKVNRRHALDGQVADGITSRYGATHTIFEIPESTVIPKAIALRRPEKVLSTSSPARQPLRDLVMHAGQLIARSER